MRSVRPGASGRKTKVSAATTTSVAAGGDEMMDRQTTLTRDLAEAEATTGRARSRSLRLLLGLLLVVAGGFVVALFASSPAQADQREASMHCWDPHADNVGICGAGEPDALVGVPVTLSADLNGCGVFDGGCAEVGSSGMRVQFKPNDSASPGLVLEYTTNNVNEGNAYVTHAYGAAPQEIKPEVRVCNSSGGTCSSWDKYDYLLTEYDLDIHSNAAPSATMQWWSPCKFILTCVVGSPDGTPQNFTLNADYDDSDNYAGSRIVSVQWDFDANGTPDQTDTFGPLNSASGSRSTGHFYTEGTYQPQVRFCDNGGCGGWDKKDIATVAVDLDVVDDPPSATMEWWSPCAETLGSCFGGSPDGRSNQNFTLNASGSDDVGVTAYEWDFDGNGSVDQSTPGSSVVHNYGVIGTWQPQVRTVDISNQRSGWDKKDIALINIDLDTDGPSISINMPNPCFGVYPACIGGSPDATTGDVVAMSADYSDAFGVSVASVEWDFDGNGSVDDTTSVSGTSGTASTTHQYGSAGTYTIKARAIGSDGAAGNWNNWKILGIGADYDVNAAQVRAQMGCPSPHTTTLGIDCAGAPDVRQGAAVTLNADIDVCGSLCVGNYFTPTDINDYDIEWDLGNGSPTVIESIGGGADRTRAYPSGYAATGAYRPLVRLCDDAASSTNCTGWDKYDVALVEYDYDVAGPSATVDNPDPCFGIYPACIAGAPDANTADVVTMNMSYEDDFGVSVASVEWDFDGNGTVDDTTSVSGTSGTAQTTHQYGSAGAYTIKARAIGTDSVVGAWDNWSILGIGTDYDVAAAQVRAQMGCPTPHTTTLGIDCAGAPDVRVNSAVTTNADIDVCSLGVLCIGNYFTPTDINDYDIEWDLGDGSAHVIESIGGGADRTRAFPSGYAVAGAYKPLVRLCDDAASSTNCSSWDAYDVALVEYDYDAEGPSATVDNPDPCFGIYPACIHGTPDASTADVVTMNMSYEDDFGVNVASVEWDFDGNGTVDDTTAVAPATSGTAQTSYQYPAAGVYTIKARAIGTDGAVGLWDDWSILGLHADYDVNGVQFRAQMDCWTPADATLGICGAGAKDVRSNNPLTLNADIDSCSLGVLCLGNYFTPTDQNDYDIEWRLGDGSPSVIDSIGGATSPRTHLFPAGYPATGAYRPEVRLCDDAATSTNCSAWDKYDVVLVEYDLDVWAPCTGDADLDGVPCYFDPDGDTSYYRHQLNYVRQAAPQGIILTNADPDAAVVLPLNMNRTLFFGNPIWTGPMNFIQADLINPNGTYLNLKWSHFGLWATTGIGSSPDTGYLRGLSFCMGAKPGSLFGYAFGFCTYQGSFDDDQQLLEIEDEVIFSSYINGYGATDYDGFTLPLISAELQVGVTP